MKLPFQTASRYRPPRIISPCIVPDPSAGGADGSIHILFVNVQSPAIRAMSLCSGPGDMAFIIACISGLSMAGIPAGGFSCCARTGMDIRARRHRIAVPRTFISTSFSFDVALLDRSGLNYAQLPHRLLHDDCNVKGSFGYGFAVLIPMRETGDILTEP